MIGISVEGSHARGMGHIYRVINFTQYLNAVKEPYIVMVNNDTASVKLLRDNKIVYEVVDYAETQKNWEQKMIRKYGIKVWLSDKFESSFDLCRHVKTEGISLAVIDDRGAGAKLADVYFSGMLFGSEEKFACGKSIYKGFSYNILSSEIGKYRRKRQTINRVVVTLGGSDTYGVTVEVVKILKKYDYKADIVVGANFQHRKELQDVMDERYQVYETVPSLMEFFCGYDLAITGGGCTCIEAAAAGLPNIIVANELHEIEIGKYMEKLGCSVFAGYYRDIDVGKFDFEMLDIENMSKNGLSAVSLSGSENVYKVLKEISGE